MTIIFSLFSWTLQWLRYTKLQKFAKICFEDITKNRLEKVDPIIDNGIIKDGDYVTHPRQFSELVYNECVEQDVNFKFNVNKWK